jgi:hypothetical protein
METETKDQPANVAQSDKGAALSSSALLACPFCGGEAMIKRGPLGGLHELQVYCLHCHATSAVVHEDVPNRVRELWNKRTLDGNVRSLLVSCDSELSAYAAGRPLDKDTAECLSYRCRRIYEPRQANS